MSALREVHKYVDGVMRTTPVLNLATVSLEGRPHSSTVWTAPNKKLERMYWLSGPHRQHSQDIDSHHAEGKPALVSGGLHTPQRPSKPVVGLSFEGQASRLTSPSDIEEGIEALLRNRVFFPDEAEGYLRPSEGSDVVPHQMYAADVTEWTVFDGRKRSYDKRLIRFTWPPLTNKH